MKNNWQTVWNKRQDRFGEIDFADQEKVFMELIRLDGFDITTEITYKIWMNEIESWQKNLLMDSNTNVFEVGCGSGAVLYKFFCDGFKIGGLDYSEKQIENLKKVFKPEDLIECIRDEAINLPTKIKYDTVFSASAFEYFSSLEYAETVIEKMIAKSTKSVGLFEIYDESKREQFYEYRRSQDENYDEHYKDLPKQFYPRKFFEEIASKHGMQIKFDESRLEGYWNRDFIFNVYMLK